MTDRIFTWWAKCSIRKIGCPLVLIRLILSKLSARTSASGWLSYRRGTQKTFKVERESVSLHTICHDFKIWTWTLFFRSFSSPSSANAWVGVIAKAKDCPSCIVDSWSEKWCAHFKGECALLSHGTMLHFLRLIDLARNRSRLHRPFNEIQRPIFKRTSVINPSQIYGLGR